MAIPNSTQPLGHIFLLDHIFIIVCALLIPGVHTHIHTSASPFHTHTHTQNLQFFPMFDSVTVAGTAGLGWGVCGGEGNITSIALFL